MKLWRFDWFSWLVASWVSFCLSFLIYVSSWVFSGPCFGVCGFVSLFFCFDVVAFYLVMLTVSISVCVFLLSSWLRLEVLCVVLLSQFSALMCYICCHVVFFWVFYEISILSLLYLLVKESPYSERYTASWYFLGYVLFCSLPMLLLFFYLSSSFGSFSVCAWEVSVDKDWQFLLLLCVLFVTKIPLFPFHSWLPVVHAEASSVVSMCLSGYVMKLGVLGVFRFGHWVVPGYLFCDFYVGLILISSIFIFLGSCLETDCKRWLALLSLSHICLVPVNLCVAEGLGFHVSFSYCLGHGLSSCMTFVFFWFMSAVSGSRSWVGMKMFISGSSTWEFAYVFCFCVCGSFPTCVQFFCELVSMYYSSFYGGMIFYLMCLYLFISVLIALVGLGSLSVRCRVMRPCGGAVHGPLSALLFLGVLNLLCFLLL